MLVKINSHPLYFILAIGLFFLSNIAEGTDWKSLGKNLDGTSIFVYTESIKHISKTVVIASVTILFEEPEQFESKYYTKMLGYEEHDCSNDMLNVLVSVYYADGTNDSKTMKEKDWSYIKPDTIESLVHDYICKSKK